MSKLDDLQKQYREYQAALKAAQSNCPESYRVYYGADENHDASNKSETIIVSMENDSLLVFDRCRNNIVIPLESVKGLTKALTDLCGEDHKKEAE